MVLEGNTLTVYAPHLFESFQTAHRLQPFYLHLQYTPGTTRSDLVDINRRRTPP